MGNWNRENRVRRKDPLTYVSAKVLLYDSIFLIHLGISRSENRNYFHTLLHVKKELLDL